MEKQKRLISRLSIVVIGLFLLGFVVAYKLVYLQLAEGETYKLLAEKTTIKNFEIHTLVDEYTFWIGVKGGFARLFNDGFKGELVNDDGPDRIGDSNIKGDLT